MPSADVLTLEADAALLRRALDSLPDNAAKYSDTDAPVTLRAGLEADAVVLEVEDRGIGIAPDDLARVGTPFFRTDQSRTRTTGGVGLGLSLARRIAEAHGGALAIESAQGVGTRVRVTLPR